VSARTLLSPAFVVLKPFHPHQHLSLSPCLAPLSPYPCLWSRNMLEGIIFIPRTKHCQAATTVPPSTRTNLSTSTTSTNPQMVVVPCKLQHLRPLQRVRAASASVNPSHSRQHTSRAVPLFRRRPTGLSSWLRPLFRGLERKTTQVGTYTACSPLLPPTPL
jgi:hypothetical protein